MLRITRTHVVRAPVIPGYSGMVHPFVTITPSGR